MFVDQCNSDGYTFSLDLHIKLIIDFNGMTFYGRHPNCGFLKVTGVDIDFELYAATFDGFQTTKSIIDNGFTVGSTWNDLYFGG